MGLELVFEVAFAAGIALAAGALLAGALAWIGRTPLVLAASVLGVAAAAAWVAFALGPSVQLALSAAGLSTCVLVTVAAFPLGRALHRARRLDTELDRAGEHLRGVMEERVRDAEAELERVAARVRADSVSQLGSEERRIGEERRREIVDREREAQAAVSKALAEAQQRVETRLAAWREDLERAQQSLVAQFDRLGDRQRQLIAEAEARVAADVERLEGTSEEQRAAVARLREEVGKAAEHIVSEATAEMEQHGADRRRALHELNDRLRRREHELGERIEREEVEAAQRIQSGFAELERRALEQLERASERAWQSYAEAASTQFADTIRGAREESARRLSRELDRAVETFSREAANVLAERLAQVGDAGAKRLEKRIGSIAAGIERQREELAAGLDQRLGEAESILRRRLQAIVADAEGERAVLEANLQEMSRRIDEAVAASRDRLAALDEERVR